MKIPRLPLWSFVLAAAPLLPAQGSAQLLWSTPWSNYTTVTSRVNTNPASNIEAADDFELHGTITRVVFAGHGCYSCAAPVVTGATVRFYTSVNDQPGALLQETFVAAGAPELLYDPTLPESVEVTLPAPFFATGRHFVSMQVHFQTGGYWDVWVSGVGNHQFGLTRIRDRLTGGPWTLPPINSVIPGPLFADLTFQLFGQLAGSSGPTWIPCQTWSELPTTMPPGADYCLLRGVKAFAPDDAWAVGSLTLPLGGNADQLTVAMHWDGAEWSQVPTPSPGPPGLVNCILYGVDGAASDDLWAAGTYQRQVPGGWVGQQVFAMHWNGSGWTVPPGLPIPATSTGAGVSGSRILDVHATATDDVWFVGDWLDVVSSSSGQTTRPGFLMHWNGGGLSQTVLPIVTNVAHQFFNSVAASSANDVWVAGGAGVPGNLPGSPVPVLFHYDGSNWTHTPCPTPNHPGWWVNLYDVQVLAPNSVWVAGISQTQLPTVQFEPFLAHWNGSVWTLLPASPLPGALAVVSPTEIYQVGSSVWRWDGAAWTNTHAFTGQIGAGLNAVDALGPCEVVAVGGQTRIGHVAPFAARLDAPQYWGWHVRLPTLPSRAPATLHMENPPLLGSTMTAAIDDPAGALGAAQGGTFWWLGFAPAPGHPVPALLPFGGTAGGAGELFLDPAALLLATAIQPWSAAGGPVVHGVQLPNDPTLAGIELFTQGAVLTLNPDLSLVFSNGLDLRVGL